MIKCVANADLVGHASETEPARSLALTRSAYAHLPAGTPLWLADDEFTLDDPALVVGVSR